MNAVTQAQVSIEQFPVPEYIRAIAPYVGGKPIGEVAREFGLDEAKIIKLASNENPLGMPQSARDAMTRAFDEVARYPDANGHDLKQVISRKLNVPMDWITLGNGSNDILVLAAHAFLQPGAAAIYSQYSFVIYALATQEVGGRCVVVPATAAFGHDLDAMLAAITPDTHLIYLANPNNPTGTYLSGAELEAFLAAVPSRVVVVLDEAYNEYLAPELKTDSVDWTRKFPNLIVSRTMSKAYGLAGLRIGYAVAQPVLTDVLNRIRQPFNVNLLAQAAAIAALGDEEFLARSYALNRDGLIQLCGAFDALGLPYVKPFGNFVLVKVGDAARINLALLKRGIIVRPVANYDLPEWLRISVGLPEENAAFIAAFKEVLGKA